IVCLYLAPMYLMLRRWLAMAICGVILAAFATGLYFMWYKHLPKRNEQLAGGREAQ
ncbi:hypothetical protein HQ563_18800, partial [bacterium]|nr:hypothetical protein [bacterium]